MKKSLFLLLLALTLTPLPALALRCGSRIVERGDYDYQVSDRCGDPYWTDHFYTYTVLGEDGPLERQQETAYDAWYYNFGPHRLLVRLLFRDGVLVREQTLGYGVSEVGDDCDLKNLHGLAVGELVARCGLPDNRREWHGTTILRNDGGIARYAPERRERWVYRGGYGRFDRVIDIVNGRVQQVQSIR